MALKSTYVQGETILPSVTPSDGVTYTFRYYPERSKLLSTAVKSLLASTKQSMSVGEISMSDKTAAELSELDGLLRSRIPANGGVAVLDRAAPDASGDLCALVDSSSLYGTYNWSILAVASSGVASVHSSGTFTVSGDPEEAQASGPMTILTRF